MNAAERLREALNGPLDSMGESQRQAIIEDAARTIALPILEADPELVERGVRALFRWHFGEGSIPYWRLDKEQRDDYESQVTAVLAALITTDSLGMAGEETQ